VEDKDRKEGAAALFDQKLDVIGVGLEGFTADLTAQNVKVTHVDWRPPAEGDADIAELLSKLGA